MRSSLRKSCSCCSLCVHLFVNLVGRIQQLDHVDVSAGPRAEGAAGGDGRVGGGAELQVEGGQHGVHQADLGGTEGSGQGGEQVDLGAEQHAEQRGEKLGHDDGGKHGEEERQQLGDLAQVEGISGVGGLVGDAIVVAGLGIGVGRGSVGVGRVGRGRGVIGGRGVLVGGGAVRDGGGAVAGSRGVGGVVSQG